jgi:hypothetical protein
MNFSYSDYQQAVAAAQANSNGDGTKVGYFRLKDDGDIAIARINLASTEEMNFASVHTMNVGGRWLKVSCHNPLGMNGGSCPLCSANAANPNGAISKSSKKMYIPMMVSYRDPNSATGYTAPVPVVWERPAGFSRELANKLMIAGDLRNTLVLITRNGKAGDMQTTYSMDILPETHPVFKPDMVPTDFSAFNNFNVARHSYWEKTVDEINIYLSTGSFPERGNNQQANNVANVAGAYTAPQAPAYTAPSTTGGYVTAQNPTAYTTPVSPQAASVPPVTPPTPMPQASVTQPTTSATPTRNFTGFSF